MSALRFVGWSSLVCGALLAACSEAPAQSGSELPTTTAVGTPCTAPAGGEATFTSAGGSGLAAITKARHFDLSNRRISKTLRISTLVRPFGSCTSGTIEYERPQVRINVPAELMKLGAHPIGEAPGQVSAQLEVEASSATKAVKGTLTIDGYEPMGDVLCGTVDVDFGGTVGVVKGTFRARDICD